MGYEHQMLIQQSKKYFEHRGYLCWEEIRLKSFDEPNDIYADLVCIKGEEVIHIECINKGKKFTPKSPQATDVLYVVELFGTADSLFSRYKPTPNMGRSISQETMIKASSDFKKYKKEGKVMFMIIPKREEFEFFKEAEKRGVLL